MDMEVTTCTRSEYPYVSMEESRESDFATS